jgi:hypothetical protein
VFQFLLHESEHLPVKTRILAEDTLILYGRGDMVAQLDQRQKGIGGQLAHAEAISKQKQIDNLDTDKSENI